MGGLQRVGVVLAVLWAIGAGAAYSEADHIHAQTIGQHGFMDADWYVCPSWDVFKRFQTLMKEDAKAAFALADRDCQKVRDAAEVIVEDTNNLWGPSATCVRPIGQPDCGWVLPGFVMVALCKEFYNGVGAPITCVPRVDRDNPQRPWSLGHSGK